MLQEANRKKFVTSVSLSVFIAATIFLFLPFTIYKGNINEFIIPFTTILTFFLFPALIIASTLCVIGILLPKGLHHRYISILFISGLLIWTQGNILVWDYGLIGKGEVDWTLIKWRGWADGTLWITLLIVAFLFYKQIYRIATFVIIILFSLQLMYFIFSIVQTAEIRKEKDESSLFAISKSPPEEIFQFSSEQNVIHFILDELQSTIFQKIIDENANHYYTAMEGFNFFSQNIGKFPTTVMSIPAILSGRTYQNNIPIHDFIDMAYRGKTITNILYDRGYEVDIAAPFNWYKKGRHTNFYHIPTPYGETKQRYELINSALMLDLVLFRCVPHFLKKFNYNSQLWLTILTPGNEDLRKKEHQLNKDNPNKTDYEATRHFAHKAFLQDLIDNVSINRSKPVYKLIHLTTTHFPAVLNEDCEYAGKILPWRWENIDIQAKCSFDHFVEFLNKLKLMGIYDSSLIILHADHGYWMIPNSTNQIKLRNLDKQVGSNSTLDKEYFSKVVCAALPTLAVKPPHSKGPLTISKAQTMLTDIPDTICSILGLDEKFNGRSVFEIDPNETRERKFYYYDRLNKADDNYFGRLDEFIVRGDVFDKDSWHLGLTYFSPKSSYQNLQKIDFGTKDAFQFLRWGWSGGEMDTKDGLTYTWALGSSASIFLSLPQNEAILLTANVKTIRFAKPQIVTVKVDGRRIGSWEVSSNWTWEKHSIVIPPDAHRMGVSNVEFNFSQHRVPNGEGDPRPLAVLFESITLSKP